MNEKAAPRDGLCLPLGSGRGLKIIYVDQFWSKGIIPPASCLRNGAGRECIRCNEYLVFLNYVRGAATPRLSKVLGVALKGG